MRQQNVSSVSQRSQIGHSQKTGAISKTSLVTLLTGKGQALALGVLLAAMLQVAVAVAGEPLVAVAANMSRAMAEVAQAYNIRTGQRVRLVFGSSGNLTRQILQGAPFEVFASADEAYPVRLAEYRLTIGPVRIYAIGRLALLVPEGSPLEGAARLEEALEMLHTEVALRIAIANPRLAPYGSAAVQALDQNGLWDDLSKRTAFAEDVAQAVHYTMSGAVAAGIVAWSYTRLPQVDARTMAYPIPAEWHSSLTQGIVLLKSASHGARDFYAFVLGPEARAIIERHGYLLPSTD